MENIQYRFYRTVYKYAINKEPISKDVLMRKLEINHNDFKSIFKPFSDYISLDNDLRLLMNETGFKYMRKLLIDKLKRRELAVSPTSLKQFQKYGPNGFLRYFLKPTIHKTPDMIYGIALETYILEPEKFDKLFTILDESQRPQPEKDFRIKENQIWKKEILEEAKFLDKYIITKDDFNTIKECALQAGVTNNFLFDRQYGESQVKLEGEYNGLFIDGIIDLKTDKKIYDLKKVQQAIFDRVKWTIQNDYLLQVTTYWWMEGCSHEISFLCIDMDANCVEVAVADTRLNKELDELKSLLNSLIKCIDNDYWDLGAEFHNNGKFFIW